jgi:hypothetical protein
VFIPLFVGGFSAKNCSTGCRKNFRVPQFGGVGAWLPGSIWRKAYAVKLFSSKFWPEECGNTRWDMELTRSDGKIGVDDAAEI